MTYRTAEDKRRAVYLLAAVAVTSIAALAIIGSDNAASLEACSAVHSADTCSYALR